MALSAKQKAFINEYLNSFNATQAAIRAGYSEKTAYSIGWENLRKPEIEDAIKKRLQERAMSADEVLMRLADIARGSLEDFITVDNDGYERIDIAKAKEAGLLHLVKKFTVNETTRKVKGKNGEDFAQVVNRTVHIDLHDAKDALKLIGTHQKLFVERTEHTGKDGEAIEVSAVVSSVIDKVYGNDGN